jgi:hypothetical protein
MTNIKSKDGEYVQLRQVTRAEVLHTDLDFVNPIWIAVWVLLFFPVAIVLLIQGFSQKKYTCVLTIDGATKLMVLDKDNYLLLRRRTPAEFCLNTNKEDL